MTTPGSAAVESPALGTNKEKGFKGCTCGPSNLRLLSSDGELVRVRGGSVNLCEYCAGQKAIEDLRMLRDDAMAGSAPGVLVVLGTRTATLSMAEFRTGRRAVTQVLRRAGVRYACLVEYTTGYGPRAGGERRPHWNWLLKDAPEDVDGLIADMVAAWCASVDAEPEAQYGAPLRTPAAAINYLVGHFTKASQRPPVGFKGKRFNCSRDYFDGLSVRAARVRAREAIALERELYKAGRAGFGAHDAELIAQEAMVRRSDTTWTLTNERGVRVSRHRPAPVELHWRVFTALREGHTYVEACDVKTRAVYQLRELDKVAHLV